MIKVARSHKNRRIHECSIFIYYNQSVDDFSHFYKGVLYDSGAFNSSCRSFFLRGQRACAENGWSVNFRDIRDQIRIVEIIGKFVTARIP